MRRARVTGIAMVGACAGLVPAASAQLPTKPPERVEQGTADVGPGQASLRTIAPDLRTPGEFDSVFELERMNRFAPPGQRKSVFFARAEGGLTAVFPRSVYAPSGQGALVPQIPPDTVFYLGLPPEFRKGAAAGAPAPNKLDLSFAAAEAERALHPFPDRREPIPVVPRRTLFENEEYRKQRVADLLKETLSAPSR